MANNQSVKAVLRNLLKSPHEGALHVYQSAHRAVPCDLLHMQSEVAATFPTI